MSWLRSFFEALEFPEGSESYAVSSLIFFSVDCELVVISPGQKSFLECTEVKFRSCADPSSFEVSVKLELRSVDVFTDGDFREFSKSCTVAELEKVDRPLTSGWPTALSLFSWFDCDRIRLTPSFKHFSPASRPELLWLLVVVSRTPFSTSEHSISSSVKPVDSDFFFAWAFLSAFCLPSSLCRYLGLLSHGFNPSCSAAAELVIMGLVPSLTVTVLLLFISCGRAKKKS